MNVDVTMPQLGETVAEGTITKWLRELGDIVGDQEPLLEISTDKVDTEVPSPVAGRLVKIIVPEDATVSVGTVLAVIDANRELASDETVVAPPQRTRIQPTSLQGRVYRHVDSPRVRRLLREHGLSHDDVRGTGPGGRVRPADVVLAFAPEAGRANIRAAPAHSPAAAHISEQPTCVVEVDVTSIATLRESTFTAVFAAEVIEALRAFPVLNASVDSDGLTGVRHLQYDLGISVDAERGVVVPILRDAGDLNHDAMSRRIADLADRARRGSASPEELSGGTFTLANTGSRGALINTHVLLHRQVGILGVGAITERAVVLRHDNERVIAVRSMVYVSLTYDHRIVDGAVAAGFLAFVKDRVEAFRPQDDLD